MYTSAQLRNRICGLALFFFASCSSTPPSVKLDRAIEQKNYQEIAAISKLPKNRDILNRGITKAIQQNDNQSLEIISQYLSDPPNEINTAAVFVAIENNNIDALLFLLNKGIDANLRRDLSGCTVAERSKYKDLNANAIIETNRQITTADGMTLLGFAIQKDNTEAAKILLNNGANPDSAFVFKESEIHGAAFSGTFCNLLQQGVKLDVRNASLSITASEEATPLTYAARIGDVKMVNLLLSFGASKTQKDYRDLSALDYATALGKEDIVKALK